MKSQELRIQRDRDLYEAYVRAVRDVGFGSERDALEYARTHRAPKFYIGGKRCQDMMGRIQKGLPLNLENRLAIEKYHCLWSLFVKETRASTAKGLHETPADICERIVEMEAPSFFIGQVSAQIIVLRERMRVHKEMLARLLRQR